MPFEATSARSLSIEQLEAGLRVLDSRECDLNAFWDENIDAFRRTVLFALRETSDALLSPKIPLRWRAELESQLEGLVQYVELADRYLARRALNRQAVAQFPSERRQLH
jgi:hypothetical protein